MHEAFINTPPKGHRLLMRRLEALRAGDFALCSPAGAGDGGREGWDTHGHNHSSPVRQHPGPNAAVLPRVHSRDEKTRWSWMPLVLGTEPR